MSQYWMSEQTAILRSELHQLETFDIPEATETLSDLMRDGLKGTQNFNEWKAHLKDLCKRVDQIKEIIKC